MTDVARVYVDQFYAKNGPCCAGCDWWRYHNSVIGECVKAAPVAATERLGLVPISNFSGSIEAGHPFTPRGHHCGDFKDD